MGSILDGIARIFTPPGTGAVNASISGLSNLSSTAGGLYSQYMPQVMAQLQGLYTPGSPLYQQLNQQAGGGAQQLQQQLDSRGLGHSSFAGNDLSGYWAGIQNQRAQLALQGLNSLGSLASGAGGMAGGAYNGMAGLGQQEQNTALGALGGLGSFVGGLGINWGNLLGGGGIASGTPMSGYSGGTYNGNVLS